MRQVSLVEAKNQLSALIDAVEKGEEIVITRHGKPAAKLSNLRARQVQTDKRLLGQYLLTELAKQRALGISENGPSWDELKSEMEEEIG